MGISHLPTTIVLADPRELFRDGLEAAIRRSADVSVIASVSSLAEALAVCVSRQVIVLLLGELLSESDLPQAVTLLSQLPPETRTLLICRDADCLPEMIEAGFWGGVTQTASGTEVLSAIRAVARGEYWAPRHLLTRMLRERLNGSANNRLACNNGQSNLTRREAEILEFVARGYSNEQIAAALFIERSTVKTHLLRTFRKLDAVDRTSAVTIALRRNLISAKTGASVGADGDRRKGLTVPTP